MSSAPQPHRGVRRWRRGFVPPPGWGAAGIHRGGGVHQNGGIHGASPGPGGDAGAAATSQAAGWKISPLQHPAPQRRV
jgi:hypothetical protein